MTDDRKRRYRAYCENHASESQRYHQAISDYLNGDEARCPPPPEPQYPVLPSDLRGLRCGAMNRKGQPCRRTDLYANGRCKFHGGLSTGPKSDKGRARARANLKLRWTKHTASSKSDKSQPSE